MRRVVILTTLTLLLLAVAGVSVAQDGFFAPDNYGTNTPGPTEGESTTSEPTLGLPAESTSGVELPDVREETTAEGTGHERTYGGGQEGENVPPEQATDGSENVRDRGAGSADAGEPGGGNEEPDEGEQRGARPGGKDPEGPGAGAGEKGGPGEEKVTICHKDKQTLSVGAAAEPAHLAHGDSSGPC